MNYPFWDIPILGSGWVIGIIAIFHVMISQFAVGGGLYLPMAERKAMRMPDRQLRADWLKQLASHSKFFLILTGVFGTVSGVGIWFAIGLTHPEATSTLIHNFVFGWAMEWVFFLVELSTIGEHNAPDRRNQHSHCPEHQQSSLGQQLEELHRRHRWRSDQTWRRHSARLRPQHGRFGLNAHRL